MEHFCSTIGLSNQKQKGVLHMLDLLYHEQTIIGRLRKYFSAYFLNCSIPTAQNLFIFVLSIIALESAPSIRFLYRHFICRITEKSLNTFYYICSYAKVDYTAFMKVTASLALNIIPEELKSLPVFLCHAAKYNECLLQICGGKIKRNEGLCRRERVAYCGIMSKA